METLDNMRFNQTDPTIYKIIKDLADREKCSWPKFAYQVNKKMTDRQSREGLRTIFDLFIDNPDKNTITFDTFKKICNEIECGLSEQQLNDIFKIAASNGDEITFKEFEEYMRVIPDN